MVFTPQRHNHKLTKKKKKKTYSIPRRVRSEFVNYVILFGIKVEARKEKWDFFFLPIPELARFSELRNESRRRACEQD